MESFNLAGMRMWEFVTTYSMHVISLLVAHSENISICACFVFRDFAQRIREGLEAEFAAER